jgi:hypothetical protein
MHGRSCIAIVFIYSFRWNPILIEVVVNKRNLIAFMVDCYVLLMYDSVL